MVAVDTGNKVKWVQKFGDDILDCREGKNFKFHKNLGKSGNKCKRIVYKLLTLRAYIDRVWLKHPLKTSDKLPYIFTK